MDIRGPNDPNRIPPPTGPGDATPAKPQESKGDFAKSLHGPGKTDPAAQPQAATSPNFDRIAPLIKDGLARNLSRAQILSEVVDDQARSQFGDKATPEMTEAIAEKFQSDPHLSSIFNKLYDRAVKA